MTVKGLLYGHPKQLLIQFLAALTIIIWDGLVTFILLKIIDMVIGLRVTEVAEPKKSLESIRCLF